MNIVKLKELTLYLHEVIIIIVFWTLLTVFVVLTCVTNKEQVDESESVVELSRYRIKIYNHEGEPLKEYINTCSVEYDRDYIFITDENGLKHAIYNPIGIVVVDEISDSSEKKGSNQDKEMVVSLE